MSKSRNRLVRDRCLPGQRLRCSRAAIELLERRRLLAADLVISEFLASNNNSIVDSFGNHEDWIEIRNRGDASANLNDYFLTDSAGNPEQWRFPVQTLASDGYLIVFASNRNLTVANQELHTNFKLSADGEYLGLIRAADDVPQFEYAPSFPLQSADVSYGLSDVNDPASARQFFTSPTPGAVNLATAQAATFSSNSGTFGAAFQLTLSTTTTAPGTEIRYTTDRSVPTASSTLYTGPINISATTVVRARVFAPSYLNSPITSRSYVSVDATVNTFSSNLPIVVLDSYGAALNDQNFVSGTATFIDTAAADGRADMLDAPQFSGRIGLRYRGSTSFFNYPKKQFAVETRDENDQDEKVSILGMPAESDWVIYDPWTEKSLLNNVLPMDWAREMGNYASRVRFVEVYFNSNNSTAVNYTDDYLGVYVLMEKPKIGANRVDIDKVSPTATTEPDVSGGYLFKKDRWENTKVPPEIKIDTPGGAEVDWQRFVMVQPDEFDITSPQVTYLTNYLAELDGVMNGPNFADPTNGYAKYIDVDSWIDFWISNEFTKNVDGFWLSTFYYKPRGGTIHMGPVWDFNLGFGQVNYRDAASASGWNHDSLIISPSFGDQYGYFKRLFQDPTFKLKVADRWQKLRKTVLSTSKMNADIDAYVALLTDNNGNYPVGTNPSQTPPNAAARNFKKWPVLGVYSTTNSYFDPQGRWIEDIKLMKNWIKARAEWIDTQFIAAPVLSPAGGSFLSPTSVTMTPKAPATFTDTSLMGASYPVNYLVPSSTLSGWQNLGFSTSGWTSGTITTGKGVGYDTTTTPVNYGPLISANVQTPMMNVRSSIYLRFSINIPNPATIDHLILKMKYDDGFYAWVNGVRVIEGGITENSVPAFNTITPAERDETLATQYVEWDISQVKDQLVAGTNILAIQGVNRAASNNDLLIVPELFSRTYTNPTGGSVYYTIDGSDPRDPVTGNPSTAALLYSGAVAVNSSKRIRARTLNAGAWSGLADEVYDFGANTLRVTEIMFNPPAPPEGSPYLTQDFEFLEVKNTGASALNLAGYHFSSGLTFSFPNSSLPAGAYGVIVKNLDAFQSRYGNSLNVLGVFTGSLDNSGETLSIQNGFDQTLHSFAYDDDWYAAADGPGYSLVIRDPAGALPNWDTAAAWRPSATLMGLPAAGDTDTTAPTHITSFFEPATGDVRLTFSEPITLANPSGVSIVEVLTGTPVTPTSSTSATGTATFSLPSLAAGIYEVMLPASGISDYSGHSPAALARFKFLYVPASQALALPPGDPPCNVDQLVIGSGGRLDLADNDLVVNNGSFADLFALVVAGFDNPTGSGITSSTSDGSQILALFDNAQIGATTWEGQPIAPGAIVGKYTYFGDANFDGQVTGDDYTVIDANLNTTPPVGLGWLSGDMNLDGIVTGDDYTVIDANLGLGNGNPLLPASIQQEKRSPLRLRNERDDLLGCFKWAIQDSNL